MRDGLLFMLQLLVASSPSPGMHLNQSSDTSVECNDVYKMCVFILLLRYLIEHNADVAAVNNDGELPIDIAETEAMEELLDRETQLRGYCLICFN